MRTSIGLVQEHHSELHMLFGWFEGPDQIYMFRAAERVNLRVNTNFEEKGLRCDFHTCWVMLHLFSMRGYSKDLSYVRHALS